VRIKDVMSKDIQIAAPIDSLQAIADRMAKGDFGFMPVVEGERLVGTVTDRDIAVRGVAEGRLPTAPAAEVMSRGATTVLDTDDLRVALERMSEGRIRRLPVVDKHDRLVGVVSLGDLSARVKEKSAGETLESISRAH
jgi:CBS domain-containing protein